MIMGMDGGELKEVNIKADAFASFHRGCTTVK